MNGPKVLAFDIETSPSLGYVWKKWEANVLEFEQESQLISVSWRWMHQKKTNVKSVWHFKGYKPGYRNLDDTQLVELLWNLWDEADVLVAHNGDAFDMKVARTRFIQHDLEVPSPVKSIDTLKQARKLFKFNSNTLGDLGNYFGLGTKVSTGGYGLWRDSIAGVKSAQKKMDDYSRQDTKLLADVYEHMLPWMKGTPNLAQYSDKPEDKCPKCMSRTLIRRGTYMTNTGRFQRYQCNVCGSWTRSAKAIKTTNSNLRNI